MGPADGPRAAPTQRRLVMGPAVLRPCQAAALPAGSLLRVGLSPGTLSGVDAPTSNPNPNPNLLPCGTETSLWVLSPAWVPPRVPLCDLGRKSCPLGGGGPGGCLPGSVRPGAPGGVENLCSSDFNPQSKPGGWGSPKISRGVCAREQPSALAECAQRWKLQVAETCPATRD